MTIHSKYPWLVAAVLALAACDGSPAGSPVAASPESVDSGSKQVSPAAPATTQVVSRETVEQAWRCQGLISALAAYKSTGGAATIPEEFGALGYGDASYWTERASSLTYDGMTPQEEDALVASSVRVIATPQAVEANAQAIRDCIAARDSQ